MKPTQEQIKTDESVWPLLATHWIGGNFHKYAGNKSESGRILNGNHWEDYKPSLEYYEMTGATIILRPTKAFVPEVGVECEYSVLKGVYKTGEVLKVTKPNSFNVYAIMDSKTNQLHWATDIRPIKSERELFVEQLAKLGKGYGSLYSEEFAGEVYDSGLFCLKEADK